jgi:hypothetical protein
MQERKMTTRDIARLEATWDVLADGTSAFETNAFFYRYDPKTSTLSRTGKRTPGTQVVNVRLRPYDKGYTLAVELSSKFRRRASVRKVA